MKNKWGESIEWYGSVPHPTFPPQNIAQGIFLGCTTTLTVGDLIKELSKHPQDSPVGVGASYTHGHITGVGKVITDKYGCIILDQSEGSLYSDEIKFP